MKSDPDPRPCSPACTKIIKFATDHKVAPSAATGLPPYVETNGYRFINIFVQFSQKDSEELPVDLSVVFAFDAKGTMSARRFITLESSSSAAKSGNSMEVSGSGSWHGSLDNISSYLARLPVMGPFIEVFVYNRAPIARVVSVWAYLVC